MHETSWQIELRIRDGRSESFRALLEDCLGNPLDGQPPAHGYTWSLDDKRMTAVIAKTADGTSTPVVTWSADWPTARLAFAQIRSTFAADLLAVAEPTNLVTFGDGETEHADDTVVDVSSTVRRTKRPSRATKKRVVVHGRASLQLANG